MPYDGFESFHFTSDDGLRLYGRDYGNANRDQLPIVCLAGLSRNSRDFHQLALLMRNEGRRVVTLDYRGRGLSDRDPNPANYNVAREAMDVVAALNTLGVARALFIGTSRGGLILHILSSFAPNLMAGLVLNDVGPVLEIEGLTAIWDYLSKRSEPKNFEQAARGLKALHGTDFPALGDASWQDMAYALFREIDGRIVADYDPDLIEPLGNIDMSKPLPDLWAQYDALANLPLMIIRGENSRLLSEKVASDMLARHPGARFVMARGQGHAPILHVPALWDALRSFIADL